MKRNDETHKHILTTLPLEVVERLTAEAAAERRSRNAHLTRILEERYGMVREMPQTADEREAVAA